MDLEQLLGHVADMLDRQGMRWALIGGLALAAYGAGRPTADVDLVVELEHQAKIHELLESSGFATLHASRGYSNHLRGRDRLDLVYVHGETARRLFTGARTLRAAGREVRVVRPEHLAAMKVLAMKNDPARLTAELADLEQLLQLPGVDRQAIRLQFERHGFKTSSASSSTDSEPTPAPASRQLDLPDLEHDLVTTPEDIEALRRIRKADRRRYSLEHLEELQLPEWLAGPPRRATSEGWEPFEL